MQHSGEWHVLIFEARGYGHGIRRQLVEAVNAGPDLAAARAKAERQACRWKPEHPMLPRRRRVFRTSPDSWTVEVTGSTAGFHFEVQLAQLVADVAEVDGTGDKWLDESV